KRPVQLPRPLLRRLQRERLLRRLRELTRQWWRERAQDLNQVMQMRNVDVAQALRSHCGRNAEEIFLSRSLYSASHYNCQHETVVHSQGAYAAEAYRMPALLRAWSSRGDTCRYLPIFHQPRFYCTSNYVLKLAFSCFPIASLACLAALEFDWRRRCIRSEGVCHELANHYGKHALPYCLWARGLVDEACSAFLATSDLLGPGIDRASMLNEVARMYAMVDMPQDAASFYLMALRELMAAGALSDSLSFEPADDRLIRIGAHFQQLALCATVFDEGQFKTGCGAVARQRWLQVFTQRFAWKPEPGPSEPAWAPFIDTEAIQAAIQLGNLSDGQVDVDSYAASIEQSGAGVSQQQQQQQREERPPQQPTARIECGLRALISLVFVHCGDGADWCRETLVHLDRLHEFTNLTSIYQSMLHAVLGERRAAIDYARDAIWLLRSLVPLIGREENDQFNEPQPGLDVSQLAAQLWQPLLDQISFHGRLPSPMRLAWRRSLSAPLLPTAVRESEETQQFAWLVGDDCSESLNLRLDSEGYLTGDVQLLAPRVPRIRLEPLTGRLLLKGYGGGGGGSSDSPCWLEPPVGADCSKSKRLESDEPRQLVLRAPCGREFTYCYSGYARLKHGCRLDTLYSVSDSGEVWRESPIKLIRRHLFKENLELLRKRSPRLFKSSKKAAELFSANPHLWDAAEKALSTLYHRQAILTASELVLKIRDYHAALQRHKEGSKGRQAGGGRRRPRLDDYVYSGQQELTVLLDVSTVQSGFILHYHHSCPCDRSKAYINSQVDSILATCHVYVRCTDEDSTGCRPRLFVASSEREHVALMTPENPTLCSASWHQSLSNFFGASISLSTSFMPRAGRRRFLKSDLAVRHHESQRCFVTACSSDGLRLFSSPYLGEDAVVKRQAEILSRRQALDEAWSIGCWALFGHAIVGNALFSVEGLDLLRTPDITRLVRCTWSPESGHEDGSDEDTKTDVAKVDAAAASEDEIPTSNNLAYSRIILGIQWLTDCGRLLAVFLPDRLALLNPDTFDAVPIADDCRNFVELCGNQAVGDDLYGFRVPSVPNVHALNWQAGQTLQAQSEIRCYRTLEEQPLANGSGFRTVLSVQGNVYVLDTPANDEAGHRVRVVCAAAVPGQAREARCVPNVGLLVCAAPLAQVFGNADAESDAASDEQPLRQEVLYLFNWSGQLLSFLPGLGAGPHSFYCEPDSLPGRVYFRDGYGAVCCAELAESEQRRLADRAGALAS
uniref:CHAT domain-containing protein n=2 Tax=Macrostomum lignano TaxID=282301 RepID=A0A1I8GUU0_9PLAT